MKIILFIIFLLLIPLVFSYPNPVGYVNDFAKIISPSEELELNSIAQELEENTTAEIAIITINSTEELTPKQYATEIFNQWKIGKENDNGLLILIAVQERRIEVEIGYGLEGILNDAKVGRILDKYARKIY